MQTIPGKTGDRIEVIDVLRGFTLLGIIFVHFTEQYYAGMPPEKYPIYQNPLIADKIVSIFVGVLISGKFFMIFSFLFGMSFYLQLRKSDGSPDFLLRFAWRLVILFAIGFLHHLNYRGDILTIYAALGFVLLVAYRLPDKALLIVAALLVFNVPGIVGRVIDVVNSDSKLFFENYQQKDLEVYFETLKSGTYTDILRANLHEFQSKMDYQLWSGRLYVTLGLFLLGLYAGRKNVFENIVFFRKAIMYSVYMFLGGVGLGLAFFGGLQAAGVQQTMRLQMLGGLTVFDIMNTALALLYVSAIVTLFQKEGWRRKLLIFRAAGRMGLTTYLMQTLAGTFIYFSWGLALLGRFGASITILIGIAVFALQIVFARFWFTYFQYGPVEWLWRSLTLLKLQPMLKDTGFRQKHVPG